MGKKTREGGKYPRVKIHIALCWGQLAFPLPILRYGPQGGRRERGRGKLQQTESWPKRGKKRGVCLKLLKSPDKKLSSYTNDG